MNTYGRGVRQQQGAALIVCLVVLLVMSVIGVASVSNSTVQQRMALNLRQQQLAENAAEHALRAAETYISTTIDADTDLLTYYNDGNQGSSLYLAIKPEASGLNEVPLTWDLIDPSLWAGGSGILVTGLSSDVTSQSPRYVIEYIGRLPEPDAGNGEGSNSRRIGKFSGDQARNFRYHFRITAIGWGVDSNAYAVLQSTYQTARFTAE